MSKKIALPGCDNCADTACPLKSCSKCKLVKYCGKPCQRQHWKAGHNKRCLAPADRKPFVAAAEDASVPKCAICLEALHDLSVKMGDDNELKLFANVKLKCGHTFHDSCALEAARLSGKSAKCTICRTGILAGENYFHVNYKNLLLGQRIFKSLGRPYPKIDTLLVAKRQLGKLAAVLEKEVDAVPENVLSEECINCQFLCKIFYLKD